MSQSNSLSTVAAGAAPGRLVVVPGLHGSGDAHWQSWLERRIGGALRVEQDVWSEPDLDRWAARVRETLGVAGPGRHVVAAHSFGCLATVRALRLAPDVPIAQMLLVAPAEPMRFGVAARLPQRRLGVPATLVASDTDPWMTAASAHAWALRWGCDWLNLGDAGHVNVASGHGPFPLALDWVRARLAARPADRHAWRVAA